MSLPQAVRCLLLVFASALTGACFYDAGPPPIERARSLAEAGDVDAAVQSYGVIARHHNSPHSAVAHEEMTRLVLAQVPSPLSADTVRQATDALRRVDRTAPLAPDRYRGRDVDRSAAASRRRSASTDIIVGQVLEWCDDFDAGTEADARALIDLVERAREIGATSPDFDPLVVESRRTLESLGGPRTLDLVSYAAENSDWPLPTARLYMAQGGDASHVAAERLLDDVAAYPLLLEEYKELVDRAFTLAGMNSDAATRARASVDALRVSRESPAFISAMESGGESLASYVDEHPEQHDAVLALAQERLRSGSIAAAADALRLLGTVEVRCGEALLLSSLVHYQRGEVEEAMRILLYNVSEKNSRYLELLAEIRARRSALVVERRQDEDAPPLPDDVQDAWGQQLVRIVRSGSVPLLSEDAEMQRLAEALERASVGPRSALLLASIATERAREVRGEAREQLIEQAESALLVAAPFAYGSIEQHVSRATLALLEGTMPTAAYHLAIVFTHDDVEGIARSAEHVVALGVEAVVVEALERRVVVDPDRAAAGRAERFLRDLREGVYGWPRLLDTRSGAAPNRELAALYRDAQRLRAEGRLEDAAARYLQVATELLELYPGDPYASHDAALALFWRHECIADVWALGRARELIWWAHRELPGSPIVAIAAASIASAAASVDTASRWVPLTGTRTSSSEASRLLRYLTLGSEGAAIRAAYAEHAALLTSRRAASVMSDFGSLQQALFALRAEQLTLLNDEAGLARLSLSLSVLHASGHHVTNQGELDAHVSRAERRVQRLERSAAPLAADAARLLLADALHRRALSDFSSEDARAALSALDLVESPLFETSGLWMSLQALLVATGCLDSGRWTAAPQNDVRFFSGSVRRLEALAEGSTELALCSRRELLAAEISPRLMQLPPSSTTDALASLSGVEGYGEGRPEAPSEWVGEVAAHLERLDLRAPYLLRGAW